jgi:hypothetical protein
MRLMRSVFGLSVLGTTLLMATVGNAADLDPKNKQAITDGAKLAQDACYKLIYRDANAYNQCIRNMADTHKAGQYTKLGIEYFGFVGGLAYRRIGQMGAEQSASEFFSRYRKTQIGLGVGDADLCTSVPGNCETRIAQAKEMEAAPPKPLHLMMRCVGQVCQLVPKE